MIPVISGRVGLNTLIPVDAAAPAGVQVKHADPQNQAVLYELVNISALVVHMATGTTAALAQSAAVAPVAGTPKGVYTILPNASRIVEDLPNAFWSGISSAPASVFVIPVG